MKCKFAHRLFNLFVLGVNYHSFALGSASYCQLPIVLQSLPNKLRLSSGLITKNN